MLKLSCGRLHAARFLFVPICILLATEAANGQSSDATSSAASEAVSIETRNRDIDGGSGQASGQASMSEDQASMSEDKDSSDEDIVDGSSAARPEPSTAEEPDLLPTVHVTTSPRGTSGVPSPSQSASAAPSINTAGSQRQSAAISLTGSESELAIADTDLQSNFDLLRDFPGSATILNQTYLEREGVSALRDLTGSSPNFTTFDGGGNRMTSISVRGVREQNYQSAPDVLPSTAFYIDDVPSLTTLGRVTVFNNIGSVTIAKGPQNTGYGLSLVGGVIDVRTPEPTEVATAYAEGSYGNYDAYEVTAGLSTPIFKEALYLSLDGVLMGRDGFYDNIARDGEPYGDKSARGGRARLTAVP